MASQHLTDISYARPMHEYLRARFCIACRDMCLASQLVYRDATTSTNHTTQTATAVPYPNMILQTCKTLAIYHVHVQPLWLMTHQYPCRQGQPQGWPVPSMHGNSQKVGPMQGMMDDSKHSKGMMNYSFHITSCSELTWFRHPHSGHLVREPNRLTGL